MVILTLTNSDCVLTVSHKLRCLIQSFKLIQFCEADTIILILREEGGGLWCTKLFHVCLKWSTWLISSRTRTQIHVAWFSRTHTHTGPQLCFCNPCHLKAAKTLPAVHQCFLMSPILPSSSSWILKLVIWTYCSHFLNTLKPPII